jgi:GT2 family glycosyltransferase
VPNELPASRSEPRVSVVVPSWNGRRHLELLLPSLAAQRFQDFETIVVDNGSGDGTAEFLAREWPEVIVVALPENGGFAGPVNRGIERAGGEFVALVNNDVELDPGFLEALVETLESDRAAGSIASRMVVFDDRERMDGAGDTLNWSGTAHARGRGEPVTAWDEPAEVFSACGGAALYRRSTLDEIGGFDEDFFAYQEDVDWGFRARLAGWTCRYEPRAIAYHVGGATTERKAAAHPLVYRLNRRNGIALVLKNYPAASLLRHAHLVALSIALGLAGSLRVGMFRTHVAALAEAARMLPRTLDKRRAVQSLRRIDPAELDRVVRRPRGWRLDH